MFLFLSLISCASKSVPTNPQTTVEENQYNLVLKTHADLALELWTATLNDSLILKEQIELFIKDPNENNLIQAQNSWIVARKSYSKTEALRFQNGPIDHAEQGVESRLNAWPLDELYIEGNELQKGLIDSENLELTKELLVDKNEALGEESISLGYHAIEFLLWGVDESKDGPGQRSPQDFSEGKLAQRRSQYLTLAIDQLCADLDTVKKAWQSDSSHLETWGNNPQQQLTGIFNGLIILAGDEMAGERMAVAYETQDQEDEQSCFSDNTLNDFKSNLIGMEQIWSTSLSPLFADDSETQKNINEEFKKTSDQLNKISDPFDQAIVTPEDRVEIELTITQLQHLSTSIGRAAQSLGLKSISLGGH